MKKLDLVEWLQILGFIAILTIGFNAEVNAEPINTEIIEVRG